MEFNEQELHEFKAILKKAFPDERLTMHEVDMVFRRLLTLYAELAKPIPDEMKKR